VERERKIKQAKERKERKSSFAALFFDRAPLSERLEQARSRKFVNVLFLNNYLLEAVSCHQNYFKLK